MEFIESVARGFPVLAIWVLMMASFLVYSSVLCGLAFGDREAWRKVYAIVYTIALVVMVSYILGSGE